MTILTSIQLICNEVGVSEPSTVINTNDVNVKRMLALTYRVGDEMKKMFQWAELTKQYDFALTGSTSDYALPADFGGFLFRTQWDVSNRWELLGPLTPAEWQLQQTGIVPPGPRRMYRVKGYTDAQFSILPEPAASDVGQILRYEYQTKVWFLPPIWNNDTTYVTGQYVTFEASVYIALASSTSEQPSVFPASWQLVTAPYERFFSNNDFFIIDPKSVELGVIAKWYRANGFAWEDKDAEWRNSCKVAFIEKKGLRQLSLNNSVPFPYPNVPESGIGQ